MEERRGTYKALVGKPRGKDTICKSLSVYGRIILIWAF
jgi:hypothetical protein